MIRMILKIIYSNQNEKNYGLNYGLGRMLGMIG